MTLESKSVEPCAQCQGGYCDGWRYSGIDFTPASNAVINVSLPSKADRSSILAGGSNGVTVRCSVPDNPEAQKGCNRYYPASYR